jgi:hypothetical protein
MVFAKLLILLMSVTFSQAPLLAASALLDLNGDGHADYFFDYQTSEHVTDVHLRTRRTNSILADFSLGPGDLVPIVPNEPHRWSTDDVFLFRNEFFGEFGGGWHVFTGPLVYLPQVYLGLRFEAADGLHFGWIEVEQNFISPRIADMGWHPTPDTPIRIGEKPTPPPPPANERITLMGIHGGEVGILWIRDWTNSTATVVGRTVRVMPSSGWEILATRESIADEPTHFALPLDQLPRRTRVPRHVELPRLWAAEADGVLLLERIHDLSVDEVTSVGPLSATNYAAMALRRVVDEQRNVICLAITETTEPDQFQLRTGSYFDYPLVECHPIVSEWGAQPPDQRFAMCGGEVVTGWRELIDADGDGLVDLALLVNRWSPDIDSWLTGFHLHLDARSGFEFFFGQFSWRYVSIFAEGTTANPDAGEWRAESPTDLLEVGEPRPPACLQSSVWGLFSQESEGYLAMRRITEEGPVYGWMHLRKSTRDEVFWDLELLRWAIDTRPNMALAMGELPPLILHARTVGNRLHLGWNLFDPGLRLEWASAPDATVWTQVDGVQRNTVDLPVESSARFFRIVQRP